MHHQDVTAALCGAAELVEDAGSKVKGVVEEVQGRLPAQAETAQATADKAEEVPLSPEVTLHVVHHVVITWHVDR